MRRRSLLLAVVAAFALCFTVADGAADPSAPTITSGPTGVVATNSANFAFTDGDAVASYSCQLDGGAASDCSSGSVTYSPLSDGGHTFSVTADAGGVVSAPSTRQWTVDTTAPPAPKLTPADTFITNDSTPTFTFTDDEPGVTFNCRLVLDGSPPGAFRGCSSPFTPTDPLIDGNYTFYVKATDAADNESDSTSVRFTVDTKSPPQPTITGPATPSSSTTAHFEFSDGELVTYMCSLDSAPFALCPNPTDVEVGDGPHALVVEARDAAGNVSVPSDPWRWTVDTEHPLVTITSKPPAVTNQSQATFTFSAAATSRYQCSLDGADFSVCTSPRAYTALPDGSHTFAVRTLSTGGTPGIATRYTWVVDTVPPKTTIASGPSSSSDSASATFTFTSSEDASTFTCRLDGAGFVPCTSPETYTGLGDGNHTFSVQAVDQAGNADGTPATYSWTIAGVGPASVDRTPPANIGRLRRSVGYGRLQLRWTRPPDADFDHVGVYVSTSKRTAPRKLVYSGKAMSYTDRRFKNGAYYRYLVVSYDHTKNASRGSGGAVPASALLQSPRNGSALRRPPTFRWTPVRGASFYNVQLYYRGAKVLSAWPKKPRQVLTRRWTYLARSHTLRRGAYVWYVWPGFGPQAKSRYGQLLGQGTFRVR